jgi:hypothetical protein
MLSTLAAITSKATRALAQQLFDLCYQFLCPHQYLPGVICIVFQGWIGYLSILDVGV